MSGLITLQEPHRADALHSIGLGTPTVNLVFRLSSSLPADAVGALRRLEREHPLATHEFADAFRAFAAAFNLAHRVVVGPAGSNSSTVYLNDGRALSTMHVELPTHHMSEIRRY